MGPGTPRPPPQNARLAPSVSCAISRAWLSARIYNSLLDLWRIGALAVISSLARLASPSVREPRTFVAALALPVNLCIRTVPPAPKRSIIPCVPVQLQTLGELPPGCHPVGRRGTHHMSFLCSFLFRISALSPFLFRGVRRSQRPATSIESTAGLHRRPVPTR